MKWSPALLLLLFATIAKPQSQLTNAQVQIVYSQETRQFQVTEKLYFDTIQAGQELTCKALLLSDSFHEESHVTVVQSGDGSTGSITKSEDFQSFQVKFEGAQKNGWIEVKYLVEESEALMEIPLYFTELSAASSAEDFFVCELETPREQSVYFHFPTAAFSQVDAGHGKQLVSFMLPALPSMIRLEFPKEVSQASLHITLIDISVAVIFMVIGVLVFRYRNLFIYG